MPLFTEKPELTDERRPLLRDPVWSYNHRYGRGRGYDAEEVEELLAFDNARNQRFQWILFLGVTLLSILILLATLGVLIKLSETHPPMRPIGPTTKIPPISNLPNTGAPSTHLPSTTPSFPSSVSSSTPASDIYVYVNNTAPPLNKEQNA